jgi:hypothetical protein
MKKQIILFVAALLATLPLPGQERVVERTYISTDKDVYVAGDAVWYSAFCVDAARGTLSPVSSVAYLELHSPEGMVVSSKVALSDGRGGGRLMLPNALPTGNYRLIAYTAQNKDEVDYDYAGIAGKTISVFNVFSNDRVSDGVEVVTPEEYAALKPLTEPEKTTGMTLSYENGVVTLVNQCDSPATFSLSVFHDDGFVSNDNPDIRQFLAESRRVGARRFRGAIPPDYEGEVIRGHVVGFSEAMIPQLIGKYAFISTPSNKSDVYAAPIGQDGSLTFFTSNIYGNKECVCEIEGIDPKLSCHVELFSPFVNPNLEAAAPLRIASNLSDALKARSVSMQVERRFEADTLFDWLPVRDNGLFGEEAIRYILDDYTRFPTMAEDFVEFISEISLRRNASGGRDIRIQLDERQSGLSFSQEKTLTMLDGVPVFNQEKIVQYDPLLVESVNIYPHTYFIGGRIFGGVANFVTYKRNLPSFTFDGSARIIDWQGVSYPMAYTLGSMPKDGRYPDYRQTIYWHPLQTVQPGEDLQIPCKLPDYKGRFRVVVEGLSSDGKPLRAETSFDVE